MNYKLKNLKLTIVFDNYPYVEELDTGWGFSCLVESDGQTLLFDTGEEGSMLMKNLRALAIDPTDIEHVFLSHDHSDHTGGLAEFLDANSKAGVITHREFPREIKEIVKARGAKLLELNDSVEIFPGAVTTGMMGESIPEHALILKTSRGAIVITGCAHPGILGIIEKAKSLCGMEILLALGGFHLKSEPESCVESIVDDIERSGVRYIAPTHCTGDHTIRLFRERFGERCLRLGSGRVITIDDLE